MKKLVCLCLTILLLLSSPVFVFATDTYIKDAVIYEIPEIGIAVPIPSDFLALERTVQEDDPVLALFGFTKTDWEQITAGNNIYLDAYNLDTDSEIIVTMTDSMLSDMNLLPDRTIDAMIDSLKSAYQGAGISLNEYEIYQHSQAKFMKLYLTQPNGGSFIYSLEYSTIYDGKSINLTLHSYDGNITPEDEKLIQEVVDGTDFGSAPASVTATKNTAGITYFDKKTGTSFSLPEKWEQKELSKERETLDVKFGSTDQEATILYGSTDFYELIGGASFGINRSDMDSSFFSEDEMSELFSEIFDANGSIEKIIINGVIYYKTVVSSSLYGFTTNMTYVLTMDNGYFYVFEYGGGRANAHYEDFEYMLNSVQFG